MKILFILFSISIFVINYSFLDYQKNDKIKSHLDEETVKFKIIYDTIYKEFEDKSQILFHTLIYKKDVIDIYKQIDLICKDRECNTEDDIVNNKKIIDLRDQLIKTFKVTYDKLKSDSKFQELTFYTSNNKVLLKMDNLKKFGFDISKTRPIVAYVNKTKEMETGFEFGKEDGGYRFIYPIKSKNNIHLGSVEISFNTDIFTHKVMEHTKSLSNFHIKKSVIDSKISNNNKYLYINSPLSGFYVIKNNIEDIERVSKIKYKDIQTSKTSQEQILKKITSKINKVFSIYDKEKGFAITFIPVKNPISNEVIAYMTNKHYSTFISDKQKDFNKIFFLSSLSILIILILFYQLFTNKEKNAKLLQDKNNSLLESTKKMEDYISLIDKNIITSSTDLSGKITYASEAFCEISGYSKDELIGKSHNIVRHPDLPKSIYTKLWDTIKSNQAWSSELKNIKKNGEDYWVDATIHPIFNEKGEKTGYTSIRHNISDKKIVQELNNNLEQKVKERTQELENQLYIDSLTKLGSYYALSQDIDKCESSFPVLMLVNIDNFQNINNLYGYETGNDVLKEFASCLNSFNKDDKYKAYRLFADKFIIFQNCQYAEIEDFHNDLMNLRKVINDHKFYIKPINDYLNIDVTAGVSIGQENPMGTVDMALRYAKKHKLSFQTYHTDLNNQEILQNTIKWKKQIKSAIEENRVLPVFQPIVDKDENIIKYEVLTRLQSREDKQLIAPHEFLEEAINAKQYNSLMQIVFDKAFKVMKNSDKLFSINLSYNDIFNNTLIKYLKEKFERYPNIASRVVIEILETEEIKDSELMKEFVKEFKTYGVKIAIDDFGVGHSNLSHILQIDPDYLKIDGAFIKNINEDKQSFAMVKSIIAFCAELDIKVIAEYVHSKEVFDTLKELGIDEYQGFYFSPPKIDID